jgi:hypothetical protein
MPVLDKLGSVGALVAAAACPICFPKLALVGALLGLGSLAAYEAQLFIAAQALVVVAMIGHGLSFRQHDKQSLLALSLLGGAAFFMGLYLFRSEWLTYAGLAALVLASSADMWSRLRPRAAKTIALESIVTCPQCGHGHVETMPTDACLFFYDCKGCGAVVRPKQGDCCVFCSYGSVKCPPVQVSCCAT